MSAQGTISAVLRHDHADWGENSHGYKFGPFEAPNGVGFAVDKNPDCSIEIRVAFPDHTTHTFRGPMPDDYEDGVQVSVRWTHSGEISLFINGELISSGKRARRDN